MYLAFLRKQELDIIVEMIDGHLRAAYDMFEIVGKHRFYVKSVAYADSAFGDLLIDLAPREKTNYLSINKNVASLKTNGKVNAASKKMLYIRFIEVVCSYMICLKNMVKPDLQYFNHIKAVLHDMFEIKKEIETSFNQGTMKIVEYNARIRHTVLFWENVVVPVFDGILKDMCGGQDSYERLFGIIFRTIELRSFPMLDGNGDRFSVQKYVQLHCFDTPEYILNVMIENVTGFRFENLVKKFGKFLLCVHANSIGLIPVIQSMKLFHEEVNCSTYHWIIECITSFPTFIFDPTKLPMFFDYKALEKVVQKVSQDDHVDVARFAAAFDHNNGGDAFDPAKMFNCNDRIFCSKEFYYYALDYYAEIKKLTIPCCSNA